MKKTIRRNITSCSSETKKTFFGLWKQWKSVKVKHPRCRDLLSFGEASGGKTSQHQIYCGWKR